MFKIIIKAFAYICSYSNHYYLFVILISKLSFVYIFFPIKSFLKPKLFLLIIAHNFSLWCST